MTNEILEQITIDFFSPVPVFFQLYFEILNLIETDILQPGDALPTEKQFCDQFHISRVAVRRAMSKLEKDNIIFRKKAIGTFVTLDAKNSTKINYGWIPLTTMIESCGKKPRAEILLLTIDYPSLEVQKQLHIDANKKISILKRLYYADNQICALNYYYLLIDIEWNLDLLGTGSVTHYLTTYHDIRIINATLKLTVDFANREVAKYMQVPIKTPLLKTVGVNRGNHGEVIGGDCSYYFADKAEIFFKVDKYTPFKWTKLF